MADEQTSPITDPFAPTPGAQPFELGTIPPASTPRPPVLNEAARLKDAARRAPVTPPDHAARVMRLQRRTGFPTALIERNLDALEQQTAAKAFNVADFRKTSPLLASWIAEHPLHGPLVQDDRIPLSAIEQTLQFGRRVVVDPAISLLQSAISLPEAGVGLADIVTLGRVGRGLERVGYQPALAKSILSSYYSRAQQQAFQTVSEADGAIQTAVAALSHPSVILHTVLQSSAPMLAGVVTGAALPASPILAAALGEGLVQAGSAAEQSRAASPTGTLTGPQAALAASSGAVTGGLGVLGGRIAQRLGIADVETMLAGASVNRTARHGLVRQVVAGAVSEGVLEELPQSVSEQLHQNVADGQPLLTGVDEAAVLGALAGAAMGGAAQPAHTVFEQLGQAATASKTIARDPMSVGDFVDRVTGDGPASQVYVPVAALTTYAQAQGLTPAAVATALTGDATAYAHAQQTGEDLAIPMRTYVTELAGTAHNAFIVDEGRLQPLAMSRRETRELDQQIAAEMAAAASAPETAASSSRGEIRGIVGGDEAAAQAHNWSRPRATREAITAALTEQRLTPLFGTEAVAAAAGLSPADRETYRATIAAALTQAHQTLEGRVAAQQAQAATPEGQAARATVRAKVAPMIAAQPIYPALALLQHGTQVDGSPLPAGTVPVKLSQAALVEQFGEGVLTRLPQPSVVTTEGGLSPGEAAELLGFSSPTSLVSALVNAPSFDSAVEAATDVELARREGDLLVDGTLPEHARAAVLEAATTVFEAEVAALTKAATRQPGPPLTPSAPVATIRELAERRIRNTRLQDLRPHVFAAAARRAGDAALTAAAAHDFRTALQFKSQQLLNSELHRAAVAAQAEVAHTIDHIFAPMLRGTAEALASTRDVNLVHAVRALLADFGLATERQAERASSYLDEVRQHDADLYGDLTAAIAAVAQTPQPYRQLTVDAFRALTEGAENLWHLSRRSKQMVIEGRRRDVAEVVGELHAPLQALAARGPRPGTEAALTDWQKMKQGLLGIVAKLRRVEHWVDAMDQGDPTGPFRRSIFTPVREGADQYRVAKVALLEQHQALVAAVSPALSTTAIPAPELATPKAPNGYTFKGTVELLGAMLHTGNDSNRFKLLVGRQWGDEQLDGTVDTRKWDRFIARLWREGTLTRVHYEYLQGVWDLLESVKPAAWATHKDLYGYYPASITAVPVVTPFGTFAGGYAPAIQNVDLSVDAARRADQAAIEETPNTYMLPTAGRGWSRNRIEGYARPLELALRLVPAHLDQVLRFIHLEPRVKDVARLVSHRGFRADLATVDDAVGSQMLMPWLQRTARQTVETAAQGTGGRETDRFFRTIRRRTGLTLIAGNVVNALQQLTGLSLAAIKVPPGALARALVTYVRTPRVLAADVAEKSAFMATRVGTQVMDVQQRIDQLLVQPSRFERLQAFALQHGYFLSAAMQNVVDLITWSGAYDHATAQGVTDADAVRRADSAVRQTQGSFNPEDVSHLESGTTWERLFTMFYAYHNMRANLYATEFQKVTRRQGLKRGAGRVFYVFMFGHLVESLLGAAIVDGLRGRLPGQDDDDEDDQVLGGWLAWFFDQEVRSGASLVPGGSIVTSAYHAVFTPQPYDDKISISPVVRVLEATVHAPSAVYDAIAHDQRRGEAIREVSTLISLLSGIPLSAVARPLAYVAEVEDEDIEPPTGPVDALRGAVVGR